MEVVYDDTLLLQFDNEKGNKEWLAVTTSEFDAYIGADKTEKYEESPIRPLSFEGDDMEFTRRATNTV